MAAFDVHITKLSRNVLMLLDNGYVGFPYLYEELQYIPADFFYLDGCEYVGNLENSLRKLSDLQTMECCYNPEEPAPGDLYLGNTAPILVLQRPQNGTCICINSFEHGLIIENHPTGSPFIVRKGSDRYLGNLNKMFREFEKELLNSLGAL